MTCVTSQCYEIKWCESYLYSPEDSMSVYAVLCATAVHHGGAGVAVVACCMTANTEGNCFNID